MEFNQDEGVEPPESVQLELPKEGLDQNQRACPICGKVFSSGKGLGGHMRIHALKKNREGHDQKPREQKAMEKPVCDVCGREFPSMSSLYGHMRCHPERTWRGVRPPSDITSSPSIDLTDSLLRWSVTARRGRKAAAAAPLSEVSSSEDNQMLDAVYNLMMLSRGYSSRSGVMHQFSESETENVRVSTSETQNEQMNVVSRSETQVVIDQTQKQQIEVLNFVSISETQLLIDQTQNRPIEVLNLVSTSETQLVIDQARNEEIEVVAGINVVGDDQVNHNSLKVIIKKKIMKKRKKKKKKQLCDLKVYRCSSCDMSFSTQQGLGGHCASHNKSSTADDERKTAKCEAAEYWSDTSQKVMDIDLNEAPAPEDEAGFGTD